MSKIIKRIEGIKLLLEFVKIFLSSGVPLIFPLKNQLIRGQRTVLLDHQDSIRPAKVRVIRVCLVLFYLHNLTPVSCQRAGDQHLYIIGIILDFVQ